MFGAHWTTMVTLTTFVSKPSRESLYQIDVALGTLDDSIVSLYGGDGSFP